MSGLSQTIRNFRNIWGHGDDDDYGQDEADSQDSPDTSTSTPQRSTAGSSYATHASSVSPPAPLYGGGHGAGSGTAGARRLRAVPSALRSSREKNIYTLKPKSQDDAAIAADYLKTGTAVIINLEDVDRMNAIRIIDFMSGVCYGLEGQGHAMKLGETIFLYTPPEFDISSDEVDYGENPDFFFKDVSPLPGAMNSNGSVAAPASAPAVSAQPAPQTHLQAQTIPQPRVIPGAQPIPPQPSYQSQERRSWER